MKHLKRMLCLAACLCLCVTGVLATEERPETNQNGMPLVGDFTLPMRDGESFTLSDALGKKVLVNFWATWCGYCVQEMPHFQEVYELYGGEDGELVVIMIDLADGAQETQEMAEKFVDDNGFTFPIAFDVEGSVYTMFTGGGGIPVTALIDEEGYLEDGTLGAVTREQLFEMIGKDLP